MKFTDELTLLLKARYPVIFINTIEEDRVEYVIRKHIKTSLNRSIYSWDFVDGYTCWLAGLYNHTHTQR